MATWARVTLPAGFSFPFDPAMIPARSICASGSRAHLATLSASEKRFSRSSAEAVLSGSVRDRMTIASCREIVSAGLA